MSDIDPAAFVEQLPDPESCWQLINNVDSLSAAMSDLLYETATKSKPCEQHMPTPKMTSAGVRWNFLKEQRDPRQLWRAINWNGTFEMAPDTVDTPSAKDFCTHYENLMNPDRKHPPAYQPVAPKYIPILDDPISPDEVENAIKSLNTNKAAGYDGVPPGLLKLLNTEYSGMLNTVEYSGYYSLRAFST